MFNGPEHLVPFKEAIQALLKTIWTGEEFKPEDERKRVVLNTNANFKKKEFQELWNRINLRTIYEVQFDTAKLIEDSRVKIDAQLHIQDRVYEVRSGAMAAGGTKEQMQDGTLFQVQDAQSHYVKTNVSTEAVYDLVGEIESRAPHPPTIVDILKAIEGRSSFGAKEPEEFIAKVSVLINEVKASLIINNIVYTKPRSDTMRRRCS